MTYSKLQGVVEIRFFPEELFLQISLFHHIFYHHPSQYLIFVAMHLESSAPLTCNSRVCFHAGDFYLACSSNLKGYSSLPSPQYFHLPPHCERVDGKEKHQKGKPILPTPLSLLPLDLIRILLIVAILTARAVEGFCGDIILGVITKHRFLL